MSTINADFWKNKRVFLTGHTGFKGSWLLFWLHKMGALVTGYSLPPQTSPNMYTAMKLDCCLENHYDADIRDLEKLRFAIQSSNPEIIFHLAAQPLVIESYKNPLETYSTNIMGTAHVLECCRNLPNLRAAILVTTDKCYQNKRLSHGYKETDHLGGNDPYSSSKACAEIITAAYRSSFFLNSSGKNSCKIATTRAGNVFGGGDWSDFRLIPDLVRHLSSGASLRIRNPSAIRPWQFVTDPLAGYLMLAQKMYTADEYSQAWNFGPQHHEVVTVYEILKNFCELWDPHFCLEHVIEQKGSFEEEPILLLDCSLAHEKLNWVRNISLQKGLSFTVQWYKKFYENDSLEKMYDLTWHQIQETMIEY